MQIVKMLSIVISILLIGNTVLAQSQPTFTTQITPTNFQPEAQVRISVSSFTIPVDDATITWSTDTETIAEGVGLKQISVQAPKSGEEKKIRVVVVHRNTRLEREVLLRPQTLNIYIESVDGYVPVWYQGRARISEESVFKAVAIPSSFPAISSTDTNTYNWSKENFVDQSQSGRGRQAFVSKLSPFSNSEQVAVTVGSTQARATVVPSPTSISLFEYSPLYGTKFERELPNTVPLTKEDMTLELIPWFFSAPNRQSAILGIGWSLNGLPTRAQGDKSILNVRRGQAGRGVAEVGATVRHTERTLQSNRATVKIEL